MCIMRMTIHSLQDPASGNGVEVYSDQPGIQLYTGNFLDGSHTGRAGEPMARHCGVCLETQAWPNAINIEVKPRQTAYYSTSVYYSFGHGHVCTCVCNHNFLAWVSKGAFRMLVIIIMSMQGARDQVILRPGERYTAKTVWKLSWKD